MAATLSRPVAEAADEPRAIYIALPQVQTRRGYLVFKRCFDFTFALLALIVLAVPMGIIAAIIALDSPGGPIYRQERLGKDGKPFLICKFRSMRMDAEKDGPKWAERSDDRCTRFGALLRKTRLDELPQLRGDVGFLKAEITVIGLDAIRLVELLFHRDELLTGSLRITVDALAEQLPFCFLSVLCIGDYITECLIIGVAVLRL